MTPERPGATAGEAAKPAHVHSDQSLILRIQKDYQKYERELEAAEQQERLQEERIRRASTRVRLGVLVAIGVLLLLVGAVFLVLVQDAVTADGVVAEGFHAPPDMAARGIDGAVLARGFLDECTRLRFATHPLAAAHELRTPWDNGSRLELPLSGFSIEEISRLLRAHYGHELRITGELVEAGDGALALTVRAEGLSARTFSGPADSLGQLIKSAAEYVYGYSAPGLWALHLAGEGRYAETQQFVQATLAASDKADKPYLLMAAGLATEPTGGSPQDARALYRAALKAKPDYWEAWVNVQTASINLGDEQGAWRTGEEMRAVAGGHPGKAPAAAFEAWDFLTWDLLGLLADAGQVPQAPGAAPLLGSTGLTLADVHARLHDMPAAEAALANGKGAADDRLLRARLAVEAGDVPRAAALVAGYDASVPTTAPATDSASLNCWLAVAEEAAGHPDRADALLLSSGTFVDCYRFRGDILDGRGDWAGARKSYGAAVALARDLPAAYYSWGLALARHGEMATAEQRLAEAVKRGPRWADPLMAWGDVLLKQGKTKEALARYDEALKYAPHWPELAQARAAAARQASTAP